MEICVLGSSSSGNATVFITNKTKVLVDCGLSARDVSNRLKDIKLSPGELDAILISHEHVDHVKGVDVLSRMFQVPVYSNPTTLRASKDLMNVRNPRTFCSHREFDIGDLNITPIVVPHDAAEPNAFIIKQGEKKVTLATDMGTPTTILLGHAHNSDAIILESNYDTDMLLNGFYPPPLKKRILSDFGHLSNSAAAKTLKQIVGDSTKNVLLAHISQNNNTPKLALKSAALYLQGFSNLKIGLTYKDKCSDIIKI